MCTPPEQRPIGDFDTCMGSQFHGQTLYDYWCQNDCPLAISQKLSGTSFGYNSANLPAVQTGVQNLFQKYQTVNSFVDPPGDGFDSFQFVIRDMCLDYRLPGVCDTALTEYCKGKSRDNLSSIDADLCGCYLDPEEGLPIPGTSTDCGSPCDPVCHRVNTIKKAMADGTLCSCLASVCVINDIAISLANSTVSGGVNITNLCPQCSLAFPCTCLISGVSINDTLINIGVGDQIHNFCAPDNTSFYQKTHLGYHPIQSSQINLASAISTATKVRPNWAVVGIALALAALVLMGLFASTGTIKKKSSVLPVRS